MRMRYLLHRRIPMMKKRQRRMMQGMREQLTKQCGDGNKKKGCADGNDVNDNVWPCSGMQARSYHRKLSIWKKLIRGEGQIFQFLGKKMDQHKTETLKWKNGVGERIEQKLADTHKKWGRGVDQQPLISCEARAIDLYLQAVQRPTYEFMTTSTPFIRQQRKRDCGWGDELDEDYNRCILPPKNGRHPGRPPLKRRESQTQDKKVRRCSKCGEVGHTRYTCRNPRADFNASYEGDVVEVEDLFDGSYAAWVGQT
ncbi:hypothetical protein Cgig2_018787 [Carnegiea gigantea]|uniref:CCHC-type domain-containing protein n=1 Tax=Carnegiea gigantea TaxID=171969 RepID=A0A9Q1K7W3_9CARY|nr:hypothetical protein Cgig2_018787 [Carnegiea gigantea]